MNSTQISVVLLTIILLTIGLVIWLMPDNGKVELKVTKESRDPAKAFFEDLDPTYISCGREKIQNNLGYTEVMRTCFVEAFASCKSVKMHQEIYTVEGDPIFTTAYIKGEGLRGCEIGIQVDSRDSFGASGVRNTVCRNVEYDTSTAQRSLLFDVCEDGTQTFVY